MSISDTFNFSLIPLFNTAQNNRWVDPSNKEQDLFTFVILDDIYYITLTKWSLTSTYDSFILSNNSTIMIPDNIFSITSIKIRLNSNLCEYFMMTYISILTEKEIYKNFIVKSLPEEKNYYYINFENKVKINTNTELLNLFKFTIEPMKFDTNLGFIQFKVFEDLKNLELITVEYSGKYVDLNDPEEDNRFTDGSGAGIGTSPAIGNVTTLAIYSNKNILENLPNYRINILEYQRRITIFENNQSSIGINKYNQISIFRIKCVNYSYITMNYFQDVEIEIPAKVRTYILGKGVLYNVNVTANRDDISSPIPEIKVSGGEFTTYKTKNDQERIQTFYVDVDEDYATFLPNKKSRRLFIVSGIDINNNNLLSNLIFTDSNPIVF